MADTDLIERATKAIDLFDAICNVHDASVSAYDRRVRAMAKVIESLSAHGEADAARIGDAVLDWMIKYDLLDGDREYHVADVLAVLDDLTPSERPAATAPVPDAVEAPDITDIIDALVETHSLAALSPASRDNIDFVLKELPKRITAALASNKPVGDGYVLVPKEPTEEMIDAGDRVMYGRYGCSFEVAPIYEAMLAASGESSR